MRIRVWKVFGREVLRLEEHEQATVSDVVAAMLAARRRGFGEDEGVELVPCSCCGELFNPEEQEEEISRRFTDLTDRIVWDATADDDDEPHHHER